MLKIHLAPNKTLLTTSKEVSSVNQHIKKLVSDMEKCLVAQKDPQGVGLAAPQVGSGLRLFIIKPKPTAKTKVFVNPLLIKTESGGGGRRAPDSAQLRGFATSTGGKKTSDRTRLKETKLEGCLSIPRIWSPIKRSEKILLEYQDLAGNIKRGWFSGFEALIIQHEIDHLDGILFTQRALEQNAQLYEEKKGKLTKIKIFDDLQV